MKAKQNADISCLNMENCRIIEDVTPNRVFKEKIFLCECKLCGQTFLRSRRWLVEGYTDCGCARGKSIGKLKINDFSLRKMSLISKRIFMAKLNVLGYNDLAKIFEMLYINNMPVNEYTALQIYISLSSLSRARRKIHKLWSVLKNEIMESEIEE